MNLHALTEPGQGAGFFLVAPLSKPALNAPNIPVQLLGESFQSLLIGMLWKKAPEKPFPFIFHLHQLQGLCYIWLDFSPLISPAGILVFRTENLVHPFQAWTKIKPRSLIPKQDRKARLLPQSLHIFLSATSNQERINQPAGWVSSISLQGKNLQRHQQAVHFLRGKKGYTYMSYKQTM